MSVRDGHGVGTGGALSLVAGAAGGTAVGGAVAVVSRSGATVSGAVTVSSAGGVESGVIGKGGAISVSVGLGDAAAGGAL